MSLVISVTNVVVISVTSDSSQQCYKCQYSVVSQVPGFVSSWWCYKFQKSGVLQVSVVMSVTSDISH